MTIIGQEDSLEDQLDGPGEGISDTGVHNG